MSWHGLAYGKRHSWLTICLPWRLHIASCNRAARIEAEGLRAQLAEADAAVTRLVAEVNELRTRLSLPLLEPQDVLHRAAHVEDRGSQPIPRLLLNDLVEAGLSTSVAPAGEVIVEEVSDEADFTNADERPAVWDGETRAQEPASAPLKDIETRGTSSVRDEVDSPHLTSSRSIYSGNQSRGLAHQEQ